MWKRQRTASGKRRMCSVGRRLIGNCFDEERVPPRPLEYLLIRLVLCNFGFTLLPESHFTHCNAAPTAQRWILNTRGAICTGANESE